MGELSEFYKDWNEEKKKKKESNLEQSTKILESKGIRFESKNFGVHLIVTHNNKIADFWPSTGKWSVRGSGSYRRGVFKLIKELEK